MNSMTGYGRAEGSIKDTQCVVEVSSVNRKNLDVKINLPESLIRLEIPLRKLISSKISRGTVAMRIFFNAQYSNSHPNLNTDSMGNLYSKLESLRKKLKIKERITISDLLLLQEYSNEHSNFYPEDLDIHILSIASTALDKLNETRKIEGLSLQNDILQRIEKLPAILTEIENRCLNSIEKRRDTLWARLNSVGLQLDLNDERLAKEIAIFAEKCDVSEELTRLKSHIAQFIEVSKSNATIGKNLDFILQEMQREIGTLSAKNTSSDISRLTILFKSELEKIREQIQNIE